MDNIVSASLFIVPILLVIMYMLFGRINPKEAQKPIDQKTDEPNKWSCVWCNTLNLENLKECISCKSPREGTPSSPHSAEANTRLVDTTEIYPDQWICPECSKPGSEGFCDCGLKVNMAQDTMAKVSTQSSEASLQDIYITKNEVRTGPFKEEVVRSMLAAGIVTPQDIGWREGHSTWQPLSVVLGLNHPPPIPAGSNKTATASAGQMCEWKSFMLAAFLAIFVNGIAMALSGKKSSSVFWTWAWMMLSVKGWKYWGWWMLLPYPAYALGTVIVMGTVFSAGGEPEAIMGSAAATNIIGLIIFAVIYYRKSRHDQ